MAVSHYALGWPRWLTEQEHSLLSCLGQIDLLRMAYYELYMRIDEEGVRPQVIAILQAIITAGRDGLHWVTILQDALARDPGIHAGDTLLGWAQSAGLDLHMLFSRAIQAAWREWLALSRTDPLPFDRPPSPHSPPPPPPSTGRGGPVPGGFWV